MALKAIIYKAVLQVADMDRGIYRDHAVTIARHPSETDERMMVRLYALGTNLPADDDNGALELAKDLWEADEPALWRRDLTGVIRHWIEVGQPDDKRMLKACSRAERVSVYSFGQSTPIWWSGVANKVARAANLEVWQIDPADARALAACAQRTMQLQFSMQDGSVYITDGKDAIELVPQRLDTRG